MGVIDLKYIRHVSDYMPELLPKPQLKMDETERAERLEELPIIKIRCNLNYIGDITC